MHIKPGTRCAFVRLVHPDWLGLHCTLVSYEPIPPFEFTHGNDCTVHTVHSRMPGGLTHCPAAALMPLDGWDAEDELALDVQNELAVMS